MKKTRPQLLLEFMLTAAGLVAVFLVLDTSIPLSCSTVSSTNTSSIVSTCNSVKSISYSLSEGLAIFVVGALLLYIVHLYGLPQMGWRGTLTRVIPTIFTSAGFSILLVILFAYGELGLGITQLGQDIIYILYGAVTVVIYIFIEYGDKLLSRLSEQTNRTLNT